LTQRGLKNPYDKFRLRLGLFMRAHSKLTESGDASFYSQSTSEVAQRALRQSNEDSNGERDNDTITKPYKPRSNEVMFMVFLVI
jgi:stress response protein SCP2